MKNVAIVLMCAIVVLSCNNTTATQSNNNNNGSKTPYVTASINGKLWQSKPSEILAKHSEFDDKLQIFTQDATGKMNFLLTLENFGKTQVGTYSSVRTGAGGYGISLLDEDKNDNEENDYDNFRQGATPNCITITAIKDVADGKIVEGTFASTMQVSNNFNAAQSKNITVSNGKFLVLISK
jgi:hypothetical protein